MGPSVREEAAASRRRAMELAPVDVDALLVDLERQQASENSKRPRKHPKRRKSPTPTRDRETAELRHLRVVEKELSAQLQELKASIVAPAKLRGRQAAWKYAARRQIARRKDVEQESRRLRLEMAAQHRLSRELIARIAAQFSSGLHQPHYLLSDWDQVVLRKLAGGIDHIYDMMPTAFPDDDMAKRVECERSMERFLEVMGGDVAGGHHVQLPGSELHDDRDMSFDFYTVIDAVWSAMTAWHAGANGSVSGWLTSRSFPGVERPEHTFAVRVRLQCSLQPQIPAFYNEKVVVRRYIEPGRFVVVWLGAYEGEVELLGSRAVELGWIVIEHTQPTDGDAVEYPFGKVRMRLYGRVIPTTESLSEKTCEAILASNATKACEEDFSFIYQHMGRVLSRAVAA